MPSSDARLPSLDLGFSAVLKAAAFAAALSFACAASGADETAPVQKPDVKVGDSWSYRRLEYLGNVPRETRLDVRVTFVAPDSIVTLEAEEGRETDSQFNPDWSANSLGALGMVYNPPLRFMSFPMQPGQSFPVAHELVGMRGSPVRSKSEGTGKVLAWEEVAVPAGKFRALKVELQIAIQRLDANFRSWQRVVLWYAPAVKRWVKFAVETSNQSPNSLGLLRTLELVEFKVQ